MAIVLKRSTSVFTFGQVMFSDDLGRTGGKEQEDHQCFFS